MNVKSINRDKKSDRFLVAGVYSDSCRKYKNVFNKHYSINLAIFPDYFNSWKKYIYDFSLEVGT